MAKPLALALDNNNYYLLLLLCSVRVWLFTSAPLVVRLSSPRLFFGARACGACRPPALLAGVLASCLSGGLWCPAPSAGRPLYCRAVLSTGPTGRLLFHLTYDSTSHNARSVSILAVARCVLSAALRSLLLVLGSSCTGDRSPLLALQSPRCPFVCIRCTSAHFGSLTFRAWRWDRRCSPGSSGVDRPRATALRSFACQCSWLCVTAYF